MLEWSRRSRRSRVCELRGTTTTCANGRFGGHHTDESTSLYDSVVPRIAGVVVSGYPHHIAQRRNGRQQTFFCRPMTGWPRSLHFWPCRRTGDPDDLQSRLQRHEQTGRPLGNQAFLNRLEAVLNRTLTHQKPGRKQKKRRNRYGVPRLRLPPDYPYPGVRRLPRLRDYSVSRPITCNRGTGWSISLSLRESVRNGNL